MRALHNSHSSFPPDLSLRSTAKVAYEHLLMNIIDTDVFLRTPLVNGFVCILYQRTPFPTKVKDTNHTSVHVRWVPVTMAWRVLRLRMEERVPIWRVAANKLNKQLRTADEGWSSSLGVGRGANNASL